MPSYSCLSSRHLPTRLLQLCPLRSAFINTTTLILGTTHCCSSNKRSQSPRPRHTYTETTALAFHPCPYCIQNLPPHVSHPFWNLSIIYVIHGYATSRSRGLRSSTRGDFAVIRTNLKFGNRAFSVAGPREWNNLPVSVRQCTSVAQFKSKLKTHLRMLHNALSCKTCFC